MASLSNLMRVSRPRERYQRFNFYNIAVGTVRAAIAQTRIPCLSFLVQADINNAGIINVADSTVTLLNGVQLDPGRAWIFGISGEGLLISSLISSPMDFAESMQQARSQAAGFAQPGVSLYVDIHDYFAISDLAGQNLRIAWYTTTT